MRLNNISYGCYNLSFFNIYLDTGDPVADALVRYPETFVHEFIHYLQDLILPYNIRINTGRLREFMCVRRAASAQGYLSIPFQEWDQDCGLLRLQQCLTIGNNWPDMQVVNRVQNMTDAQYYYEPGSGFDEMYAMRSRTFNIYSYGIWVNGGRAPYYLGARDLLEYIAHKIEAKQYPSGAVLPQLPYETVDLLFEHYGLSSVPLSVRICIAEFCLYNDNPVRLLFSQFLENENFRKNADSLQYEELYADLLAAGFMTTDGVSETIQHKTYRKLKQFEEELGMNYAGFTGLRNWIALVNAFAEKELAERFVFSDMYQMDKKTFEEFISSVINQIGLPLVMNRKKECVSLQSQQADNAEFIQFYILQEYLNFVSGVYGNPTGSSTLPVCPVYDFCRSNWGDCKECCVRNPKSVRPDDELCPYARFLRAYGLENVGYVWNSPS